MGFIGWKNGELCGMYVDPDFQRQSIGSQLVKAADNLAQEKGEFLTFLDAMKSAQGFYENHGFKFVSDGSFNVAGHTLPDIRMER